MLGKDINPKLQQVEEAVKEKVPPDLMNAFERIVVAGEKIMYSEKTRQMLTNQLNQQGEPSEIVGQGVAKLLAILFSKSKGTMPMKAAIPAAQVLLCEALDFMEKSGIVQVSDDLIASSTKAMMAYTLQLFGFPKEKIEQYMQAGQAGMQGGGDEGAMAPPAQGAMAAEPQAAPQGIINGAQGAA